MHSIPIDGSPFALLDEHFVFELSICGKLAMMALEE